MKATIDLYVAQHGRALECSKDITDFSKTVSDTKKNAEKIRLKLANLAGILKAHFSSEDRLLYSRLITNDNPVVAGTAQKYWDEMRGITVAVMSFLESWRKIGAIEHEPEIFFKESQDIFAALKKRIDSEEAELYPTFLTHTH